MSTKTKHPTSTALRILEDLTGGPLTFAELLESIRLGEGWSQTDMAGTLGVSRSHICDLEKGRKQVSPERAGAFARTLGYPVSQFVRLALQDQVTRAGLDLTVEVKAA